LNTVHEFAVLARSLALGSLGTIEVLAGEGFFGFGIESLDNFSRILGVYA